MSISPPSPHRLHTSTHFLLHPPGIAILDDKTLHATIGPHRAFCIANRAPMQARFTVRACKATRNATAQDKRRSTLPWSRRATAIKQAGRRRDMPDLNSEPGVRALTSPSSESL
ncbi:hypothetical protein ACCO45_001621 [Purpureocillium lilacinum]|uniref:Uncharacterized protein n=1 Tax=Purpureocillium lilacinum TaxID=33203 RepID=A0ACC4E8R8_PURLI